MKRMKGITIILQGAILISIMIIFLGIGKSEEVIKFGEVTEQTGTLSSWGIYRHEAAVIAIDQINRAGGFDVAGKNYKWKLISFDNRSIPAETVAAVKRLIDIEKVHFQFATGTTVNTSPVVELLQDKRYYGKILNMSCSTALRAQLGKPGLEYMNENWNADFGEYGVGKGIIGTAKDKMNLKKVSFLDANDSFGRIIVPTYQDWCKKFAVDVISTDYYPPETGDFYPQLSKIANLKPDALIFGYTEEAAIAILRQALEKGINRFVTNRITPDVPLRYKDKIKEFIGIEEKDFTIAEEKSRPIVAKYIEDYKRTFGKDPDYIRMSRIGGLYDYIFMLTKAIQMAGSTTDIDKIQKMLRSIRYEGIWTTLYDNKGQSICDYSVYYLHDGKMEKVRYNPPEEIGGVKRIKVSYKDILKQ